MSRTYRNVIDALEAEWPTIAHSPATRERLRMWAISEPALAGYTSLVDVVLAVRTGERDVSTAVSAALVRVAGTDALARRALLQIMIPVMAQRVRWLRTTSRMVGSELEVDEAAQTVVAAMVEVIGRVGGRSVDWPISCLRSKLRKTLFITADRHEHQVRTETQFDIATATVEPSCAAAELEDVLVQATRRGVLTGRDSALVWMTRVGGWEPSELTERFGATHTTLLRRRQRAEAALGRVA
jgi:hypothetical protein